MPIYDFKCEACGNVEEVICAASGREHAQQDCGNCEDGVLHYINKPTLPALRDFGKPAYKGPAVRMENGTKVSSPNGRGDLP